MEEKPQQLVAHLRARRPTERLSPVHVIVTLDPADETGSLPEMAAWPEWLTESIPTGGRLCKRLPCVKLPTRL
jgi:hypothetical protein